MDRSAYIKTIETSQKDKFRSILDLDGTLALAKRRKRKFPISYGDYSSFTFENDLCY